MDVTFRFEVGDRVTTVLGDEGVIDTCAVEKAGNRYYVIVRGGTATWYHENKLVARVPSGS